MDQRRSALIVANDEYDDPKLSRLRGPTRDADALSRVLADPSIGAFDVAVSHNEPSSKLRRRLAEFFADRSPDDLLLLHFSCHGIKDDDGILYFATPDTEVKYLDASAIPSDFVNRAMSTSRSRRIALFLDCCYSGAFSRGGRARAGDGMDIAERFNGRGQVVITASSAMEYSFEGEDLVGEGRPSVFTTALVEGLENGAADRDGDGYVSIDELYEYVYSRVRDETPSQTPRKWVSDFEGEFMVARNPRPDATLSAALPSDLEQAVDSPYAAVREGAARELAHLLVGRHRGLALAAERALRILSDDDSRRVSEAAAAVLAARPGEHEPDAGRTTNETVPARDSATGGDSGATGKPNVEAGTAERATRAKPAGKRAPVVTREESSAPPRVQSGRSAGAELAATHARPTDDSEMVRRRGRLWGHIRGLGFGPRRGRKTWYHPTIENARFTDSKNSVTFERLFPDGKWHVWETFPLFQETSQQENLESISFVVQHKGQHSPAWERMVNAFDAVNRRLWIDAYHAGKPNPWSLDGDWLKAR